MGYYWDKDRKKYIGRVTVHGHRIYLGQFSSPAKEQRAEAKFYNDLARAESHTLESHKMKYEHQDISIEWLKPFKKWIATRKKDREFRKAEKFRDLETTRKLEEM